MNRQVRIGQLIAPFGPGAIYTDRRGTPLVVCGLDHWFKRWNPTTGFQNCDDRAEFERVELRLAALLGIDRFCMPPDYRMSAQGQVPPPNAFLYVAAQRFPRWYRNSKTGLMRKFNLDAQKLDNTPGGGRWLPVRFISVCARGHLSEFPWKDWIGCTCPGDGELYLTDRGGSELRSIRVECRSCPDDSTGRKGRDLSGTTTPPAEDKQSAFEQAKIACQGDRPWLGEGANEEGCKAQLVGALINQTNLYFPKVISAILVPDLQPVDDAIFELRNQIQEDQAACGLARTIWNMNDHVGATAYVQARLTARGINRPPDDVTKALDCLFCAAAPIQQGVAAPSQPESELLAFRRVEFNAIRQQVNDPKGVPNLRVIPCSVSPGMEPWIAKVNLVERLRETRVFYGFDRLQQDNKWHPPNEIAEQSMLQLFRNPPQQQAGRWLPAIEVFGEGIYIELQEQRISEWLANHMDWIIGRLDDRFVARLAGLFQTLPPIGGAARPWAAKYLLIHSLAHIIINQLVFECGYSTASLRERLYISADPTAPMAGMLIYTAAGDSEGTLGGLVRLGRPERFGHILRRALSRASWCSADPVCSENLGGQGSRLVNLAACHACVLLPETSCETINQGLDRAMVVGTPDAREHGFMENAYALA